MSDKPEKKSSAKKSDLVRITEENARKDWLVRFTGAVLTVEASFGSPLVQRMYNRVFDITGRNAHFISVFGRVLLTEEQVHEPEAHVINTVKNARKDFENKISQCEAIIADAGIDGLAKYNAPKVIEARIISPIQREFLRVLVLADKEMLLLDTLYLEGQIPDLERTKRQRDVKWKLRNIATAARNMFITIRRRVSDSSAKGVIEEGGIDLPSASDNASLDEGEGTSNGKSRKSSRAAKSGEGNDVAPVAITETPDASQQAAAAGG